MCFVNIHRLVSLESRGSAGKCARLINVPPCFPHSELPWTLATPTRGNLQSCWRRQVQPRLNLVIGEITKRKSHKIITWCELTIDCCQWREQLCSAIL